MTTDLLSIHDELASCRSDLAAAEKKIVNLAVALETSREIGCAVGILMATFKISYDDALAMLICASQRRHVKVRAIAENVILTGCL